MRPLIFALCLLPLPLPLAAQTHAHGSHSAAPASAPSEAGQGGFAALAEIVALLRADPATDWDRVDLSRLRAHLQDMDRLVTDLVVAETRSPQGLVMTIDRDAPGAGAAWRMVPAHGPVLAAETGWHSEVAETDRALTWTVSSPSDAALIRGLGFFGLMATGNHHPAHHLALARGAPMH